MIERSSLPDWPRLMAAPLAAAYVGISETTLRAKGPRPREVGKRRLYDRIDLDRWADRLSDQPLDFDEVKAEADDLERRFLERRNATR